MNKDLVIKGVELLLDGIGIDGSSEHLRNTPRRVAEAFCELFSGYEREEPEVTVFESSIDQIVVVRNIEFVSMCAHHMLPFVGIAHVGYLPDGHIIGLSKFARVVEFFSKRLQVQEELTKQIADFVMSRTKPKGCAVIIEARHYCVAARGVKSKESDMVTSVMLGAFREDASLKEEFMSIIREGRKYMV